MRSISKACDLTVFKYYVLSIMGIGFFVFSILHTTNYILPTVYAASSLDAINQRVCDRLETDTSRLAAIMDEVRSRKGITETRVAFGGSDTPIKQADYWINFAAEAIAYQRAQQYSTVGGLKSGLQVLAGKVLKAKQQVAVVLQ